jgi:hypothetical protein
MIGMVRARGKGLWITVGVFVVLLAVGGVLLLRDGSSAPAGSPASRAADVLAAADAHYRTVFVQGRVIVGTARYIDDMAALSATKDPHSAAARFGDWRKNTGIENDVSYLDAFDQAQVRFAPGAAPKALSTWRDDIAATRNAIAAWVRIVPGYEFGQQEQTDLDRAAAAVSAGFDRLDNDVAAVRAN